MCSYGLPLLGLLAVAVLVVAAVLAAAAAAALAALAVVLAFVPFGFAWWEALPVLRDRYWDGVARNRPPAYWMWGNLAALAFSAGPLLRSRAWPPLSRAAAPSGPDRGGRSSAGWCRRVAMVLAADLSQMSRAEVERIWLPFVPWLLARLRAAARPLAAPRARAPGGSSRCWCSTCSTPAGELPGLSPAAARSRRPAARVRARSTAGTPARARPAPARRRRAARRPSRNRPVTTGSTPAWYPGRRGGRRRGCSPASPEQTLYAANLRVPLGHGRQRRQVRARHVGRRARSRAPGRRPRRPAAARPLQGGAEDRGDAGVRRVPRHPGPVHVVVPQRDDRAVGLPGPGGRIVLLGDLAGGVRARGIEPRALVNQLPAERAIAVRAVILEVAGLQRGDRAGAGATPPCSGQE